MFGNLDEFVILFLKSFESLERAIYRISEIKVVTDDTMTVKGGIILQMEEILPKVF